MCKLCSLAYSSAAVSLAVSGSFVPLAQLTSTDKGSADMFQQLSKLDQTSSSVAAIKAPTVKDPKWLSDIKAAEIAAKQQAAASVAAPGSGRVVTYDVITRGNLTANLAEFKQQANVTLNDSRGWSKMGVSFKEVASGGQFTLALSEAAQMTSFSADGCGTEYSCRVGRYVIINQDRWLGATPSWNAAGGSLRDYRHMVVNHETGHWLGHGHQQCGGAGQQAPVMQQQSMSLQGCTFNAWPTAGELQSSQLGIKA